jgi:hypothetical protein
VYPKYPPDVEKEAALRSGHKEGVWWCVDGFVLPQATQWKVIRSAHDTELGPRCNTGANKQDICGDWNNIYSKIGLPGLLPMLLK